MKNAEKPAVVLVISHAAGFCDSLRLLVSSLSTGREVLGAEDLDAATSRDLTVPPGLVVLDGDLPLGQLTSALGQIKARWPQARILALAEDDSQRECATAAGADRVLMNGIHPVRLLETMENLLTQHDEQNQQQSEEDNVEKWDYCQLRRVYVPAGGWDLKGEPPDPHLPDTSRLYTFGFADPVTGATPQVETLDGFEAFAGKLAQLGREGWTLIGYTQFTYQAALDGPGILHAVDTYTLKSPAGKA